MKQSCKFSASKLLSTANRCKAFKTDEHGNLEDDNEKGETNKKNTNK